MYIVEKPWGYESRLEVNSNIALTFLNISPSSETSLHCHPVKTTSMICVSGEGEIAFFGSTFRLTPGKYFTIRNGLFHQIRNLNENQYLTLFEFENPSNKDDLIRYSDTYGRTGLPYEKSIREISSFDKHAELKNLIQRGEIFKIGNLQVKQIRGITLKDLDQLAADLYVVLEGCIIDNNSDKPVLRIGDCIGTDTLRKIITRFGGSEQIVLLHFDFGMKELNE